MSGSVKNAEDSRVGEITDVEIVILTENRLILAEDEET